MRRAVVSGKALSGARGNGSPGGGAKGMRRAVVSGESPLSRLRRQPPRRGSQGNAKSRSEWGRPSQSPAAPAPPEGEPGTISEYITRIQPLNYFTGTRLRTGFSFFGGYESGGKRG